VTTPKALDIVQGTVTDVYAYDEGSPNRPAKIIVNINPGSNDALSLAEVAFFNAWDGEFNSPDRKPANPPRLGAAWDKLGGDAAIGQTVQLTAIPDGDYQGRPRFKIDRSRSTLKILDRFPTPPTNYAGEIPPVVSDPAPSTQVPWRESDTYVPTSRQEIGTSIGNSKNVASPIIAAYVSSHGGELPEDTWLVRAAAAVNTFSAAILSGLTYGDMSVLSEDDDDAPLFLQDEEENPGGSAVLGTV